MVKNSLPDGAVLVEVDEDEASPELDQAQAVSPPPVGDDSLKTAVSPVTPGGNHRISTEKRKEKGSKCIMSLDELFTYTITVDGHGNLVHQRLITYTSYVLQINIGID